jgi:hypothetical protein
MFSGSALAQLNASSHAAQTKELPKFGSPHTIHDRFVGSRFILNECGDRNLSRIRASDFADLSAKFHRKLGLRRTGRDKFSPAVLERVWPDEGTEWGLRPVASKLLQSPLRISSELCNA